VTAGGGDVRGAVALADAGAPAVVPGGLVAVAVFDAAGALDVGVGCAVAGGRLNAARGTSSAGGSQYLYQPYHASAATAANASSVPRPERRPRRAGE
jgi:hypothetical protein